MNFFWSPSPTKWSTKTPQKIRGKFGAKLGTKNQKLRETFVLQLFWPNKISEAPLGRPGIPGTPGQCPGPEPLEPFHPKPQPNRTEPGPPVSVNLSLGGNFGPEKAPSRPLAPCPPLLGLPPPPPPPPFQAPRIPPSPPPSRKNKNIRNVHQVPEQTTGNGSREASKCREAKIAARKCLPLNCRTSTLTAAAILKEEKKPALVGRGNLGGVLRDNLGEGTLASQKLPGDSIFAARHQDVSQGPQGGTPAGRPLFVPPGIPGTLAEKGPFFRLYPRHSLIFSSLSERCMYVCMYVCMYIYIYKSPSGIMWQFGVFVPKR